MIDENEPPLQLDYKPEGFIPLDSDKYREILNSNEEPLELNYKPKGFIPLKEIENSKSISSPKYSAPQNMDEVYNRVDSFLKNQTPEQQKEILSNIIRMGLKAPAAGIGQILDFFVTTPNNALGQAYNTIAPQGYEHTPVPSLEENIEKGVDILAQKGGLDTSQKTPAYEGTKFAAGLAAPAGVARTAAIKAVPKFAEILGKVGSLNPKTLAGAFGAGAAMEEAREKGAGIGEQLGSGVIGTIGAEALANPRQAFKSIGKGANKLAASSLGLGRKNIKTEALDAAENLGLEGLPSAAVTDSIVNGYLNQVISKTPYFGNKLRKNAKETSEQFQNAWNKMLDSVSPSRDQEANKEINSIYKKANNLIKNDDIVSSNLILDKINETRDLLKSPIHSEPTKKLYSYMNELEKSLVPSKSDESMKSIFNKELSADNLAKFPEHVRKLILEKSEDIISQKDIYVKDILRAKVELNKIMRDKNIFDRTDTDSLSFLKGIQQSIKETLEQYGKVNPKWHQVFREAEDKYSKLARRTDIEELLGGLIRDYNTNEVKYHSLVNTLENPANKNILRNGLGEQNFKKIEDFVKVAQSMSNINKNILNPSSSAIVGSVLLTIQGLAFGTNILPALTTTAGTAGITKLLTDKKFLNKVNQFAKDPNESIAKQIDTLIKNHLGVGALTLQKQIKGEYSNK